MPKTGVCVPRGTAEDLGTPAQVPDVVAALAAKYTGEGDRQYLPDADPDFDVVYAIKAAVGDHVAPGRLRSLAAPVDLLSLQCGPGKVRATCGMAGCS